MARKSKTKTFSEYINDLNLLYSKKAELIKQRIETENKILKKGGSVIYLGYTYLERLTGHRSKNLNKSAKFSILSRQKKIEGASRKPYNKFYAMQIDAIKSEIKQIDGRIRYVKKRITAQKKIEELHAEESISAKEFIGKEKYTDMTTDEKKALRRAQKRKEEELRKMELGLPPYDKIKIKKL